MLAFIESIDISLFYLINRSGQNDFFDLFMPFISNIKNFYFPMAMFWLLLVVKKSTKTRVAAISIIVLIGISEWVSSDLLKPAFDRPRPYHSLSYVHLYDRMFKTWSITPQLLETIRGESYSMPSSHATNIFAGAFFLSFFFRKWSPVFYLIAFMVGYSRVYLGVHFPFDVFVGAIVGTLCSLLVAWPTSQIIRFFRKRSTLQ
ncbi:MAG: phosphatase PAP2 family protein [Deltaproteobacteria bacterium]|nr:phosphatase PAP2 family protein [Deltaproteobacteria bacterium]MBW1962732.1 phosphatase PAP2 family protein [Deltaproteobacteria bacterium]MBW1994011.1 phosphatase PAP2 family protein [Deltaproteobacteria bacterium]MBW2150838.1 phosphatase PAP2 family protein [Deltaproteobacteria bacterium]